MDATIPAWLLVLIVACQLVNLILVFLYCGIILHEVRNVKAMMNAPPDVLPMTEKPKLRSVFDSPAFKTLPDGRMVPALVPKGKK